MLLLRASIALILAAEFITQLRVGITAQMIILMTHFVPEVSAAARFLIRKTQSFIPAPQADLIIAEQKQSKTLLD
jgi:hypothetical protein